MEKGWFFLCWVGDNNPSGNTPSPSGGTISGTMVEARWSGKTVGPHC